MPLPTAGRRKGDAGLIAPPPCLCRTPAEEGGAAARLTRPTSCTPCLPALAGLSANKQASDQRTRPAPAGRRSRRRRTGSRCRTRRARASRAAPAPIGSARSSAAADRAARRRRPALRFPAGLQPRHRAARLRADRLSRAARFRRRLRPAAPRHRDAQGPDGAPALAHRAARDGAAAPRRRPRRRHDRAPYRAREVFQKTRRRDALEAWLRALLEDMFVIDAATLYCQRTRSGGSAPCIASTAPPSSA